MGMWGPGSDFYKIDVFLKMGDGARHFKNHPHNPPPPMCLCIVNCLMEGEYWELRVGVGI